MQEQNLISRRAAVKSSLFGLLCVSIPNIIYASKITGTPPKELLSDKLFHRYPSIDDEIVAEVVGASHFNLDRVKVLVNKRPELARASWDWAFGDWETALGAASHVGRRDIAEFLMSKGARPDIFTYAMMGAYNAVKAMIEASPGIQSIDGPHGISLLRHAIIGMRGDGLFEKNKKAGTKLIDYLRALGDAENKISYIELSEAEQEKYLGDYKYGEGPNEGLSIKKNMQKLLALGKLGKSGGAIRQISANRFLYNGISSVEISFEVIGAQVISLTVKEPGLIIKATKL